MFCGACWVELNKPRSRYECYNDLDAEIMNYLVMIERYPKEFDLMKQGVYGLVSQELCNRIVRGELKPRNDLERAYFFYYLNKLTFGGDVKKIGDGKKAKVNYGGMVYTGHGRVLRKRDAEKRKKKFKETVDEAKEGHAHYSGIMRPTDPCRQPQVEKIKDEWKTKGYIGLIDNQTMSKDGYGRVDKNVVKKAKASFAGINNTRAGNNASNMRDMEKWKEEFKETVDDAKFRGVVLPTVCKEKSVNDAKDDFNKVTLPLLSSGIGGGDGAGNTDNIEQAKKDYKAKYGGINIHGAVGLRQMSHKRETDIAKATFKGIANHGATGWGTLESGEVKKAKEQYQAVSYKGLNPKTTRPYHNNDCGLLTPLDQKAIERLRYVNLTCYEFKRVYKLFYNAFHVRKGLGRECFIYADPPYPGTEKYYGDKFSTEDHQHLIDLMLETPFNFMLSIGKDCQMYLDQLSDWVIVPVKVRYSTDANSQKLSQEYIIMNYEINEIGNMQIDNQKSLMGFF